jgi:hypothetical protein
MESWTELGRYSRTGPWLADPDGILHAAFTSRCRTCGGNSIVLVRGDLVRGRNTRVPGATGMIGISPPNGLVAGLAGWEGCLQ